LYSSFKKKDADYSYYLGPDYKEKMSKCRSSTIVGNHVSWFDTPIYALKILPALAPKDSMKSSPIISMMANSLSSLWICRGGTREEKDKILEQIRER
jgi:hypothetical protein